jgi:hypothetical protein
MPMTAPQNSLGETQVKRCSVCHAEIPKPTDDLTKPKYELYLQDGFCEKCRRSPERIELFNECSKATYHIPQEQKAALEQLALDPCLEERFNTDIHRTVKFDDAVIENNKAAGLSTYVDPFSASHKSIESGSGKTYDTTETFSYFPDEDIITVATQSPKVITHEQGTLMTINEAGEEEPLELENAPVQPKRRDYDDKDEYLSAKDVYKIEKRAWDKKLKNAFDLLKLNGKIYILLETVPKPTLEMLKSTMSHDGPRITHKYVDEHLRVRNVVLEGAPAFIFCSIDEFYYSEFATRVISDTPETTEEKIRAGKKLIAQRRSYPWEFKPTQDKILIKALIRNIRDTIQKFKLKFINPFPNCDELIGGISVRDMRDFDHFQQLLSAKPILSLFQRPIVTIEGEKFFVATVQDFIKAEKHFKLVYETTQTNTDKRTLTFYHEYVQHHVNGATLKIIVDHIYDPEHPDMNYPHETKPTSQPPTRSTARRYLGRLSDLDWVDIHEEEQADKRELTYYPLKDVKSSDIQTQISEITLNQPTKPDLEANLIKDFKLWKKTISNKGINYSLSKIEFNNRNEVPITEEEFDKIITGKNEPLLAIVLNQEQEPEPQNKPETNTNQQINVDTPISNPEKSALGERLEETYALVKQKHSELGPFDIKLIEDQEALKILMREGKVFEPQAGYIAPTEA